jgi:hypothetical protein
MGDIEKDLYFVASCGDCNWVGPEYKSEEDAYEECYQHENEYPNHYTEVNASQY